VPHIAVHRGIQIIPTDLVHDIRCISRQVCRSWFCRNECAIRLLRITYKHNPSTVIGERDYRLRQTGLVHVLAEIEPFLDLKRETFHWIAKQFQKARIVKVHGASRLYQGPAKEERASFALATPLRAPAFTTRWLSQSIRCRPPGRLNLGISSLSRRPTLVVALRAHPQFEPLPANLDFVCRVLFRPRTSNQSLPQTPIAPASAFVADGICERSSQGWRANPALRDGA
jgi:hypothetical protein